MTYAEAAAFLDRLTNFEKMDGYRYDSKNFGLERTRRLLAAAGSPQRKLRCAIIAGTKGKGSTAALLTSLLAAAGGRPGLYTSPHLVEYRERIRIGGEPVSPEEFGALAGRLAGPVAELEREGEDLRPTTFEVLTAMALLGFAERGVDVAVLEVGMGGRLDAVNAVEAAAVAVTAVSLDHTAQLGNTIGEIAREKAGVVKSPAPVVSAPQPPAAAAVLEEACREAGAPLRFVGRELRAEGVESGPEGSSFAATTGRDGFAGLKVKLLGRHQVENALVALGLLEDLGVGASGETVRRALATASWPGRLQVLARRPWVVLDGAHNGASAEALARACRELFAPERVALIFGQLRGHDHEAVADALCALADRVFVPRLKHPRALDPEELARIAARRCGGVEAAADVATAVAVARRQFPRENDLILVAGSLSLVGEALAAGVA